MFSRLISSTPDVVLTGLRLLYLGAICFAVVAFGTPVGPIQYIVVMAFGVVSVLTLMLAPDPKSPERTMIVRISLWLSGVLFLYVLVQSIELPNNPLAHPIWSYVEAEIGSNVGSMSIYPTATREALLSLALPFLVFVSGFMLFTSDEEAMRLWQWLAYIGAGVALFGVIQYQLWPSRLLFFARSDYPGSLVATFPNRNTAATFLGLTMILLAGLVVYRLNEEKIRDLDSLLEGGSGSIKSTPTYVYALCGALAVVFVALLLTKSRGGIAASLAGLAVMVAIIVYRALSRRHGRQFALVRAGIGPLVLLVAFAIMGGQSIDRITAAGTDDPRWCSYLSTQDAIKDNLLVGTGLGTFEQAFTIYRKARCSGVAGSWTKAHNSFLEGLLGLGVIFIPSVVLAYWALGRSFAVGLEKRRRFRFAAAGGIGGLVLISLHSLIDFSIQIPGFAVFFSAFLAASVSLCLGRIRTKTVEPDPEPEEEDLHLSGFKIGSPSSG